MWLSYIPSNFKTLFLNFRLYGVRQPGTLPGGKAIFHIIEGGMTNAETEETLKCFKLDLAAAARPFPTF
jgi:hypothetical protein